MEAPLDVQIRGGWRTDPFFDPTVEFAALRGTWSDRVPPPPIAAMCTIRSADYKQYLSANPAHRHDPKLVVCAECRHLFQKPNFRARLLMHARSEGRPPQTMNHRYCSHRELLLRLVGKDSTAQAKTIGALHRQAKTTSALKRQLAKYTRVQQVLNTAGPTGSLFLDAADR